jgi:imidazolonepropionase-like amidohydrolase
MKQRLPGLILAAWWLSLLPGCAPSRLPNELVRPGDQVIRNVTILTAPGFVAQHGREVIVRDHMIVAVQAQQSTRPAGATIIDGGGGYLIPGFVDMHAHLLVPRCEQTPGAPAGFDIALSERMMGVLLDFGITSIRSPANPTVDGLALRDRLNQGEVRGPFARASAELINDPALTPDTMRAAIRATLPSRPDYIKFYTRIRADVLAAGVDEAHRHGLEVIGHLGATSWRQGTEAGIDYLTHAADWSAEMLRPDRRAEYREAVQRDGAFRGRIRWLELLDIESDQVRATIAAIARRGIAIDPTLVAYEAKFTPPTDPRFRANRHRAVVPELLADWQNCGTGAEDWTEPDYRRWAAVQPKLHGWLRMLHDAGVPLLVGSDLTNPWVIPGESLHQELSLLTQAGFSPQQVLTMATTNGAAALRLGNRIGRIAPGLEADMVLLRGDPVREIGNSRTIQWVMEDGRMALL